MYYDGSIVHRTKTICAAVLMQHFFCAQYSPFVEDEIVKDKTSNNDYRSASLIRRLSLHHHPHHPHHHYCRPLSLSLFIYIFIERQKAEDVYCFCCCFIFGFVVCCACRRLVALFIDVIVKTHEGRTKTTTRKEKDFTRNYIYIYKEIDGKLVTVYVSSQLTLPSPVLLNNEFQQTQA